MGYRAGMRLNISENVDASFLFLFTSFFEGNDDASFKSDVDAIGLHLGYTLNSVFKKSRISPYLTTGIQRLGFDTKSTAKDLPEVVHDRESIIAIPLGLGLRLNISERIDLDATFNYTIAMGDIDKSPEDAADRFMSANFTIHYDLFTPRPREDIYFDDSYYADVNFKAMDVEDEDGDLIADVDDYCPKTPIGIKVDKNGCPLDGDNDGIPDYIDQEKNTIKEAVVDEKGVRLTAEKYHSMYSDYEAASREYANFYNENEIRRENYKTIDAYLIAKANAFNKAYNEGEDVKHTVAGLQYKVKIGAFSDGVPANVINKYLSLDDLESISEDNGVVIYTVGSYNTLEEALSREYELEAKGFNETSILVDNNGEVSNYAAPVPEPLIDEAEIVVAPISEQTERVEGEKEEEEVVTPSNETIYRIQIGAFKNALSDAVFKGVENVVPIKGKDWIRYMTGLFTEYKDAVSYMHQMRARGFEDAFIVTYKNGERISLHVAIETDKKVRKIKAVVEDEAVKPNIEFTVQILVAKKSLSPKALKQMTPLGKIDKKLKGQEMYRYFAGTYSLLEDANTRLSEAKLAGFTDAFIFATLDGERITLKQAKELLK
jgi:cell division protein FtsN